MQDTSVGMPTSDEWMVDTPSVAPWNWRVVGDHAGTEHAQDFGSEFVTPATLKKALRMIALAKVAKAYLSK